MIYGNPKHDDALHIHEIATLALKYRDKGVCGFGILGGGMKLLET